MADNTGRYVRYAEIMADLSAAGDSKVTTTDLTLSSKLVDSGGDIYEYTPTTPLPAIGDVLTQAGSSDEIIAVLTAPDRIQIARTGAANPIVNGVAKLVQSTELSKASVEALIDTQMEFIDQWTGQFFNKRTGVFLLEGNNNYLMHFNVPIIEITKLLINETKEELFEGDDLDFLAFKGRAQPQDDRRNPKIRLNRNNDNIFTGAVTNRFFLKNSTTEITGSFGFLEPNGSTPALIQRATKLLVFGQLQAPAVAGISPSLGGLRRVKVDLHEKEFFEDRGINRGFQATPNKEVNNILGIYKRPIIVKTTFRELRSIV